MTTATFPDDHDGAASAAEALHGWLLAQRRIFVLGGAGISTGSGIPDYRGADGQWKGRSPMTYQSFVGDPARRARYWARSFVGWPAVAGARPNSCHDALATLERRGHIGVLVTQNVDRLHQRAGQREVIDLHGRLDQVICLHCGLRVPRAIIQQRLLAQHPHWAQHHATLAPDGDAELEDVDLDGFHDPTCTACGGMLKPDVVFFGENVPRPRLAKAIKALEGCDAMLVVGSSLMVYSGFRFARLAREAGMPLAILTRGVTRADDIATLKLDAECGATLQAVLARQPAA